MLDIKTLDKFTVMSLAGFQKLHDLTCGLYYKHITIINDDSSVISKWHLSLIDDARVVIYDRSMFIIQATGFKP